MSKVTSKRTYEYEGFVTLNIEVRLQYPDDIPIDTCLSRATELLTTITEHAQKAADHEERQQDLLTMDYEHYHE